MIEQLKAVEKYEDDPSKTPVAVTKELLSAILPNYKHESLINIGGEGILIKAINPTGKYEAVKVARSIFQGRYSQTPQKATIMNPFAFKGKAKATNINYERFLEGAKLQQDLSQQLVDDQVTSIYIPPVLSINVDPLFYTMPYLDNIPILRYLRDFNKKLRDILLLFVTLLRGVEYLHERGIIHRDYKSDNLMIHKNFKSIIVLDWTGAKPIGNRNLTVTGSLGGTPGFASDKLMSGSFRDANFRDDIYALGFVFWEFLTCKRIAGAYELGARRLKKDEQEGFKRKIAEYIPEPFKYIFWKATDYTESERYDTVTDFLAAIKDTMGKIDTTNINTIVGEVAQKEIENIVDDVIFDTTVIPCFCDGCENPLKCKEYELCNKLYVLIRSLR